MKMKPREKRAIIFLQAPHLFGLMVWPRADRAAAIVLRGCGGRRLLFLRHDNVLLLLEDGFTAREVDLGHLTNELDLAPEVGDAANL